MRTIAVAVLWVAVAVATPARAGQAVWTDWVHGSTGDVGFATGTLAVVGAPEITVTYTGEVYLVQTNGGTDYWTPADPYISSEVTNGPPGTDIIGLVGGHTRTNTITFSRPVTNPVMAILSLGDSILQCSYDFDAAFEILSYGPGYYGEPGTLTNLADDVLFGTEGHGTIRFNGVYTSISWTVPTGECWHGFTVGYYRPPDVCVSYSETATSGVFALVISNSNPTILVTEFTLSYTNLGTSGYVSNHITDISLLSTAGQMWQKTGQTSNDVTFQAVSNSFYLAGGEMTRFHVTHETNYTRFGEANGVAATEASGDRKVTVDGVPVYWTVSTSDVSVSYVETGAPGVFTLTISNSNPNILVTEFTLSYTNLQTSGYVSDHITDISAFSTAGEMWLNVSQTSNDVTFQAFDDSSRLAAGEVTSFEITHSTNYTGLGTANGVASISPGGTLNITVSSVPDYSVPIPTVITRISVGANLRLTMTNAVNGSSYDVECTTNLLNPTWTPVTNLTATNTTHSLQIETTNNRAYYRIRSL